MDYESFQKFMQKHDFDENELKMLNEIMKWCIIPQNKQKTKRKTYSFRLIENDMIKIKSIADIQWIPYQTLVGSIIHQYANGNLK
jgi:predicted DNA binding CopG/RHH family protein